MDSQVFLLQFSWLFIELGVGVLYLNLPITLEQISNGFQALIVYKKVLFSLKLMVSCMKQFQMINYYIIDVLRTITPRIHVFFKSPKLVYEVDFMTMVSC